MTLTISLPDDSEKKLKARAAAAGQALDHYVQQIIVKELEAPLTLVEAAEPFARAVESSGVTDDELTQVLVEARDAARRDRRP